MPSMIIDFHTHTFPEKIAHQTIDKLSHAAMIHPFTDGTAEGLLGSMEKAEIDFSLILPVATSPRQVESVNEASAELNADDTPLLSYGCMHPEFGDFRAELSRVVSLGLRGIKIHPVYQGVDLDDVRFLRIFDRAAELGLSVVTHTGDDIGYPGVVRCSPQMAANALREIGDFSLICAHMGGWGVWDEAIQYLAGTSCLIDTAFSTGFITSIDGKQGDRMLSPGQFMKLVDAFGPERILFGTDSPWSDADESVRFIKELPLSDEAREKIFYGNAAELGIVE